mmetsp:Transcript_7487/g.10896  ORF Transcript_7487/g.10896 Transcript_7487/m.10896 type:complete len:186 (+) Transcript_7487:101-658(+)|eukprot:CAMPEP_0201687360 /NCGR_PEP_ID=MMETSP0578-20130828/1461_1 /ASSEMBLY_ACC=CAM_ASM_000663 /TAXON_ID=267565 /ORGANISM="Skeletonema grethea, Strain CCMP 1804" /LENGTH=185 /DNA_ID=CAMNT_0048171509 /DNA_START=67 /DNA_END=624 /DNA_ORIENTATION=-
MPYRSAILNAIESLQDHETGSPISCIRRHILDDTDGNNSDDPSWNEVHFQKTLKTLVEKGDLIQINGINYKFSNRYLQRRVEALRARAESIEEQNHKAAVEHHHAREIPPKEAPKKKTVHAKMKINEGKIITVVNPEVKHEDDMDTTPTEEIMEVGEMRAAVMAKNKKHVKIIPRKVVGTAKNVR